MSIGMWVACVLSAVFAIGMLSLWLHSNRLKAQIDTVEMRLIRYVEYELKRIARRIDPRDPGRYVVDISRDENENVRFSVFASLLNDVSMIRLVFSLPQHPEKSGMLTLTLNHETVIENRPFESFLGSSFEHIESYLKSERYRHKPSA